MKGIDEAFTFKELLLLQLVHKIKNSDWSKKKINKWQAYLCYVCVLIYWNKYLVHENFKIITQYSVHHKIL